MKWYPLAHIAAVKVSMFLRRASSSCSVRKSPCGIPKGLWAHSQCYPYVFEFPDARCRPWLSNETSLFRDRNLTYMFTSARRVQILHLEARVRFLYGLQNGMKLSTQFIWSIYLSLWDLPKLNVFWLKHLVEDWFVSRRTSSLSSQKGQITLKFSVNFAFPKIYFTCCPEFWKRILKA